MQGITEAEWTAINASIALIGALAAVAAAYLAWRQLKFQRSEQERIEAGERRTLKRPEAVESPTGLAPIGRDGEAKNLHRHFDAAEREGRPRVAAIHGGPGLGKTTLARLYSERHADGARVFWIAAVSPEAIEAGFAEIAKALDGVGEEDGSPAQLAEHAKAVLAERGAAEPFLIVLDNIDKQATLTPWLVHAPRLRILVTSRSGEWAAPVMAFPLGLLTPVFARELLEREAGRKDDKAADVVERLDRLPLAIMQAGQWLRAHERQPFAAYLALHRELLDAWAPDPARPVAYDRSVFGAVALSLRDFDPPARPWYLRWRRAEPPSDEYVLLAIFAFLAPDSLDPSLVNDLSKVPEDHPARRALLHSAVVMPLAEEPSRPQRAADRLCTAGLLERGSDGRFKMHRVTQDVIQQRLGQAAQGWAETAAAVVAAGYPGGRA
ncbi:MAG: AAA family ATPase, partial [Pseudomonadota bacterium]